MIADFLYLQNLLILSFSSMMKKTKQKKSRLLDAILALRS